LDVVTPTKIQGWKAGFLKAAGADPVSQKTARVSVNAFLRNAKALFSPKLLTFIGDLKLPDPLPFAGVAFEKPRSLRYRSTIDPEKLLAAAQTELAANHPEQFKIFVLALLAGLRRNEIDKLPWSALDFARGVIRIEATEFFQPKSEDSSGDVEVNPKVLELLQTHRDKAHEVFVIHSDNAPRPAATFNHYRAEKEFAALNRWLRAKGVTGRAPLHVLRKEFGSLMNEEFGIYAASRALRHGRLEVTSSYYTDRKSRKTLSLGSQLA
jgi:integrase